MKSTRKYFKMTTMTVTYSKVGQLASPRQHIIIRIFKFLYFCFKKQISKRISKISLCRRLLTRLFIFFSTFLKFPKINLNNKNSKGLDLKKYSEEVERDLRILEKSSIRDCNKILTVFRTWPISLYYYTI
jgi:hypothetical protein